MEQKFIASLRRRLASQHDPRVILGIGDDAAVLANETRGGSGEDCHTVVTVDLLTEDVDFHLSQTDPRLIGRKALAVNLSDLAAMAAVPTAILVAVAVPRQPRTTPLGVLASGELLEYVFSGIHRLAREFDVPIVGGDTNSWDRGLVVSVTALGATTQKGILRRDGAKSDDRICVTGTLGGSFLERQFTFRPRVRESLYLNEHYGIHAAIDVSDGLSLDLFRVLEESRVDAVLYENEIPISEDAVALSVKERDATHVALHGKPLSPLEHALRDGEDFELLFTCPEETARRLMREQPLRQRFGTNLSVIGEITQPSLRTDADPSRVPRPSMWLQDSTGNRRTLPARGFAH